MAHSSAPTGRLKAASRRIPVSRFKRCPLCGAVNAKQNTACFVCDWRGVFESDPERIAQGLDEFLSRCPEVLDILHLQAHPPTNWLRRLRNLVRRLRAPLDIRA